MKAARCISAEIDLVMPLRDVERLRQPAWARAKPPHILHSAAFPHERDTEPGFDRSNENESITRAALDENVQHPVHAVVKINVSRAGLVPPNELPRARSAECVARFVAFHQIRLCLNNNAGAFFPDELCPDKISGAFDRISLEEIRRKHPLL